MVSRPRAASDTAGGKFVRCRSVPRSGYGSTPLEPREFAGGGGALGVCGAGVLMASGLAGGLPGPFPSTPRTCRRGCSVGALQEGPSATVANAHDNKVLDRICSHQSRARARAGVRVRGLKSRRLSPCRHARGTLACFPEALRILDGEHHEAARSAHVASLDHRALHLRVPPGLGRSGRFLAHFELDAGGARAAQELAVSDYLLTLANGAAKIGHGEPRIPGAVAREQSAVADRLPRRGALRSVRPRVATGPCQPSERDSRSHGTALTNHRYAASAFPASSLSGTAAMVGSCRWDGGSNDDRWSHDFGSTPAGVFTGCGFYVVVVWWV